MLVFITLNESIKFEVDNFTHFKDKKKDPNCKSGCD